MRTFDGLDDLRRAVGTTLGYSAWHTVTQEQINTFAEATGDDQWIHIDPQRAAAGRFGGTIAHGYLTLSLLPMLVRQVYQVDGLKMGVNYGINKVRFPAPVPVDSKLRALVELLSLEPAPGGHRAVSHVTVEREGSDKPVCVAETLSLLVQ
ncbi:MaoC family dehydratase [Nocardia sp. NPDC059239]|uniref:MaoC family dehydratase n=1 Tax=Nocardia sp. NPDC059239 TaxID=3346785 RepID=UPI00367405DD